MAMTRTLSGTVLLVCLALLTAAGCRRKPQPPPPPSAEEQAAAVQKLMSELNEVFLNADQSLANGRTNVAIAQVEAAVTNARFATYRPQIFDGLLHLLLRCGEEAAVRQRALATCGDPALARGACGLLYSYYRERGDLTNAVAWSAELSARTNLLADLRLVVYEWNIDDHLALRDDGQALAVLGQAARVLKPPECATLIGQAIETLFAVDRLDTLERVLAFAEGLQPRAAAVANLATVTRLRLRAARSEWEALTNEFSAAAQTLPDGDLERLLRAVVAAAQKAGKHGVVNQCAERVVSIPSGYTNASALAAAARIWAENAMATDKGALPGRLNTLLRAHVPARNVTELFTRYYYEFTEMPTPLKELLSIGERLAPLAENEDTRNELKTKLLDGYFLVHDYDRALTMLEAGIPGRDRPWHTTAIIKVKAHRALERHEPREAVKFFREFMGCIRTSKDSEIADPVTGTFFTKEMILGRNAKRIGDILAGIPDADEAAKAYAEARDLYAQSLTKTKDADARKVIEDEMAQLPK